MECNGILENRVFRHIIYIASVNDSSWSLIVVVRPDLEFMNFFNLLFIWVVEKFLVQ